MKKKLFQAGIGIGLLLLISPTANAQWVRTNGPGGQAVTALAASGQNIYAGTNKGVYFSSDKGENWTEVNSDAGSSVSAQITALAVYDSDVFAATAGGIFLSTNAGTGWAMVNTGLPYNFQITCFAESDSNVFIGTNRVTISGSVPASGVFISTQPHHDTVWSYDTVWFNDTGTIYDTIWSFNPFDSSIMIIDSIIKIENSVIKRVDSIEKTVKSINSSMKWNKVNTGLVDTNVNCIAVGGSTVFAGTSSGVFRTTNNGTNWTAFNSGLANTTVTSLSVNGNFVFAGTSGDLFITTIDGTNWIAANSVINDSGGIISSLAVIGDNIFAGTNHGYSTTTHGMIGTSGSIFLSANNGSDWKKVDTGLGGLGIYALAICDNTVFIGNYRYFPPFFFRNLPFIIQLF